MAGCDSVDGSGKLAELGLGCVLAYLASWRFGGPVCSSD